MVGIFSAFGLSASAGLNAYLPLLIVAVCAKLEVIKLNAPFDALTSWWAIGVLVVLLIVEMFVDKIPAVDTINNIIQTIIRPAAGALLFAASANVVTDLSPVISIILGLIVAGGVHAAKSIARPVVTATTAGAAAMPFLMASGDIADSGAAAAGFLSAASAAPGAASATRTAAIRPIRMGLISTLSPGSFPFGGHISAGR